MTMQVSGNEQEESCASGEMYVSARDARNCSTKKLPLPLTWARLLYLFDPEKSTL